ncbi:MAG: potassium transport protein Kup, partial [Pseudomonadota bacterium]
MSTSGNVAADGHARQALPGLVLGAIGVVFGDIGTSPLYALKECFAVGHGASMSAENLLGVVSLIFWAVLLVVSVKYVSFIMRADNKGEGGILALLSLVMRLTANRPRLNWVLTVLGVFGATLFYGDAVITPAISVLSAVEGIEVIAPAFHDYVVPTALVVLIALFAIQRFGTASVGRFFGPVMVLWFLTLGVLGVRSAIDNPAVLAAANPAYALGFLMNNPGLGFITMGSVVLAVTGGEALYMDMGHFGRKPIRLAWFGLVWPSLLCNYFGQAALLLRSPEAISNPFFLLAPDWLAMPLIALATLATVIASQSVISGAFSLTRQAMVLGYLPRMRTLHTSAREIGQIYVPLINWLLLAGVVFLVLEFRTSSGLAAAYGIAVTGSMLVDSILVSVVMIQAWRWKPPIVIAVVSLFLCVDVAFLGA